MKRDRKQGRPWFITDIMCKESRIIGQESLTTAEGRKWWAWKLWGAQLITWGRRSYFSWIRVWDSGSGDGLVSKSYPTRATPWTVAHQAPLSMEFSRQEYWSGLPFPSPGNLPNPRIKHVSSGGLLHCRLSTALQVDSLPLSRQEKSLRIYFRENIHFTLNQFLYVLNFCIV